MLREQLSDGLMALTKRLPDRYTPSVNQLIPLSSFGRGHDLDRRDRSSRAGQRKLRPKVLLSYEVHVRPLDLLTRKLPFDVQVETDERKGERNWFCLRGRVLSRESIHDVLMNK